MKILILFYFIIVLGIVIFTLKEQTNQDMEHFSLMSVNMEYSKNKDKCLLKYKDDKDKYKTCKSYYKCKKKCGLSLFDNKKCKKKCKEKKLNLYRDDEGKMEKIKIKEALKNEMREEKRKLKIKTMEIENKKKELEEEKTSKTKGYFNRIVNDYLPEEDKIFLVNMNSGSKKFKKDFNKVFSKYFN